MNRLLYLILYFFLIILPLNAQDWKAGTLMSEEDIKAQSLDKCFRSEEISDEVFLRMNGKSFSTTCRVDRKSLRYLRVLHYNKEGKIQRGEMICNKSIAADLLDIFRKLYTARYRIERMQLVDDYEANDEKSMTANNTSCFNFRFITGTRRVSKHGLGMAVDINPLYNPCYTPRNGKCEPAAGSIYAANRTDKTRNPMLINKQDLCYRLFIQHGFRWGGAWKSKKDYQHFEK